MKKIGIYYGSTTGVTEEIAGKIADGLGVDSADVKNVADGDVDSVDSYEALILGSSTWGVGELQDDWYSFLEELKEKDLSGKTIALFGCGDSSGFGSSFCDALSIIHNDLQGTGAKFCGSISTDGYSYEHSESEVDGKLLGLLLDEDNESDSSDKRISDWVEQIKAEL